MRVGQFPILRAAAHVGLYRGPAGSACLLTSAMEAIHSGQKSEDRFSDLVDERFEQDGVVEEVDPHAGFTGDSSAVPHRNGLALVISTIWVTVKSTEH
jgi:hypothetical protein